MILFAGGVNCVLHDADISITRARRAATAETAEQLVRGRRIGMGLRERRDTDRALGGGAGG